MSESKHTPCNAEMDLGDRLSYCVLPKGHSGDHSEKSAYEAMYSALKAAHEDIEKHDCYVLSSAASRMIAAALALAEGRGQ